ncbi:uncharacterized protein LOC111277142 [Durio zibethinus]|uniref:Uncharacterized protein LOC111277142 n=1 Tax=Durio zibethinus TaxID=66656 RepID=A0A6P5WSJ8_DURZI|nr:uncharacterized protein LOC111277142 [Durio zibethinus]
MALVSTNHSLNHVDANPVSSICRSESFPYGYIEHNCMMMEKRQLFLRSYQFCRKRSLGERIKRSLVRVKRVMWFRLRSARKLRRLVFSRLRFAFYLGRRYIRLKNNHYRHSRNSSCFWDRTNCPRHEALLKDGGDEETTAQMGN